MQNQCDKLVVADELMDFAIELCFKEKRYSSAICLAEAASRIYERWKYVDLTKPVLDYMADLVNSLHNDNPSTGHNDSYQRSLMWLESASDRIVNVDLKKEAEQAIYEAYSLHCHLERKETLQTRLFANEFSL